MRFQKRTANQSLDAALELHSAVVMLKACTEAPPETVAGLRSNSGAEATHKIVASEMAEITLLRTHG